MKTIKKCLSLFLALLTLFSICSASTTVFAAEYTEQKAREEYFDSALSGYLKNIVDTEDAVSISEKQQVDEAVEEVNSSVSRTASTFSLRAASVQSTENVKETVEELDIDHTRLTLELEDGENVAYLFSEPVSFIDDEGNLVYKDTNIKAVTDSAILNRGYSYENGDNDYKAYFSEDSSKGLLLVEKDGEEIRLVPNGTASVGTVEQVESDMEFVDSFEYAGVYGTDTVLRFLPQLNGCKEEIVLSSYQGISDFSFTLYTEEGTIAAINSNGEVEIIDSATKDIITTFVAPFANDSSGGLDITSEHYTDCTYELETVSEGKYTLTICVPEEYLESESTVYPVIIDPTTSNISMELDTAVYSSRSDSPQGANPSACFGKTGTSEYGKGRALYYFPLPSDIKKYAKISSAKLWLREVTGRDTTMYVRPYFVTESWNNSTTWNTQPAYSTTFSYLGTSGVSLARRNINSTSTDHATVPYWYAFNITNAVRAWSTGTSNKGVMFIAECEAADGDYLWRGFATKEHTTSAFRPYAVITYTNDTTKPVISKVTASTSAWTNENVTLTVTASDNVYGIYRYSFIDGDGWRKTNNKTFSENGTIQIRVKDYAGNISDRYTYVIDNIDKTAPTISKVALSSTSWTNGSVKVTVTASDSASGLAAKAYSFDNGSTWQANNYKSFSSNTSTINIKVRDALGNIATYSSNPVKISNIDKTAPTASASADVTSASVKITVTASDELSGLHSTAYSFDEGAWQASNVYLTEPCETITIKVRDKANNIKEFEYTPPAIDGITVTPSISNDEWTNGKVVLTVNGSGIVKYKFGDNDWQTENYFEFAENGEVVILVEDENGFDSNAPTYNITNIDKTDPVVPSVYEQDGTLYISAPSLGEKGGSPETLKYQLGDNNEDNYIAVEGNSIELDVVRTYNVPVYAYVEDGAGNKAAATFTLENNLGEYTASYTDIAFGEGLFPVEFGRTYTSTNGWFFTFDANVAEIDENSYVFTDFYGEKQYFIKNSKGQYLSVDEEELTIVESTDEETGDKIKTYSLNYGDMIVELGNNRKLSKITTDYTTTEYKWNTDGSLDITGGATVSFAGGKPTGIEIERENKKKTIEYNWTTEKILETDEAGNPTEKEIIRLTSFKDAAGEVHTYNYLGETELLTKNDTETISYSNGRVKLISQPNGAFVKYTYNDNAENAEAPNNVGAVTVSDSKGVTDTIYYADGVYISNTLDSYSDNVQYDPDLAKIEAVLKDTTEDIISPVVYVVEEQETGSDPNSEGTGTDESTPVGQPKSDGETATDNDIGEETNGVEPDTDGDSLTDNEAGDTDDGTENGTESGEDNNASSETETPLYEEIDENTYVFYTYDEQKRVTAELKVLKVNLTIDENTTFESAEAVAESKVTYAYVSDEDDSITVQTSYIKSQNGLAPDEKECYTYDKGNVLTHSKFKYIDGIETELYSESNEYNDYGNITTHTETQYATEVDAFDVTYTTSYTYDVWGMCTGTTVTCGEDVDTTITEYDLNGVTLSVTYNDERVKYTYNDFGSVTTETVVKVNDDDTETFKYSTTYTYDEEKGNLLTCKNPDGDTSYYHYDPYGNLTWHTFNDYYFEYNTLGSIMNANVGAKVVEKDEINEKDETNVKYEIEDKGTEIVAYNYEGAEQELSYIDYKNGQRINYDYDEATGDLLTVSQGENAKFSYSYSTVGKDEIITLTDSINSIIKVIENDKVTVKTSDGKTDIYSVESLYEDEETPGSFNGKKITVGSDIYTLKSKENKDSFYVGETGTEAFAKTYENDYAGNLWKVNIANAVSTQYGYNENKNISTLKNTLNGLVQTFGYGYDDECNITTETLNIVTSNEVGATVETNQAVNYTYDEDNQLLSAETADTKWAYTYDGRGNITSKTEYSVTIGENNDKVYTQVDSKEYVYGDEVWADKLTEYDEVDIEYDVVGNPVEYLGNTLTWTMGRQLASFGDNTYTYNEDGIRTSKTVNTVTTTYYLDGTNIIEQSDGTNTLHFYYDSNDEVIGFTYNEADYFYVKNAMSDIIGIVDDSGNLIVSYAYDAWGKVLSVTGSNLELGNLNPFRYRSYYYDSDIEMYYLQSRYYDPEVCRFINSDDVNYIGLAGTVGSYNAFAYCENRPLIYKDEMGYAFETVIDVASIGWSAYELFKAPTWINFGNLVWDIGAAFIPFAPGSYVKKAGKVSLKIANKVDDFKDIKSLTLGTYKGLKKLFTKIKNIEVHHIIEKRFYKLFDVGKDSFLSVPLTKELHKTITKRWRNVCKYGTDYKNIGKKQMKAYVRAVYYDMPKLRDQALKWLDQHWKGKP